MDLHLSLENFKSKFVKKFIVFIQNNVGKFSKNPALPSVVVKN